MAFKRSAVRSRLSPPRPEISKISGLFSCLLPLKTEFFEPHFSRTFCGTPTPTIPPTTAEHPYGLNRCRLVYWVHYLFFSVVQFAQPLELRSSVVFPEKHPAVPQIWPLFRKIYCVYCVIFRISKYHFVPFCLAEQQFQTANLLFSSWLTASVKVQIAAPFVWFHHSTCNLLSRLI